MRHTPLYIRVRPSTLKEFVGQEHILAKDTPLRRAIEEDRISSLILWGPPGTGKTTFALCLKNRTASAFSYINAATSNLEDLRKEIKKAFLRYEKQKVRTLLFVDEIHHFNRRQQDVFLPVLEENYLILVGATIHNPFFYLLPPLLSRSFVLEFKPFSEEEIEKILRGALQKEKPCPEVKEKVLGYIARTCDGDARRALNILEVGLTFSEPKGTLRLEDIKKVVLKKHYLYDRREDEHYNTISAFIKSLRGSDPDAAIYYLSRVLSGGEDPLFVARRLVILASEDIGNADPFALVLAVACKEAVHFLGMPEARLVLAQTTLYLATAPKSNASYVAFSEAEADGEKERTKPIPDYLKVSSYKGAATLGHGKGYKYPHNFADGRKIQEYAKGVKKYYRPKDIGFEKKIKERMK